MPLRPEAHSENTNPLHLARALEDYLAANPNATLLEDGQVLFDMAASNYSLSTEHGRCVVHFWSEERNLIRTVVGIEERRASLRILVRRLGIPRPQSLQLAPNRDHRAPSTRALARSKYLRLLERVLSRTFLDYKLRNLTSAMDLEHSFGPAYARGLLTRGQTFWAVIGTGVEETQASINGALTLGILWFSQCRQKNEDRLVCQGLKVIVPKGTSDTLRERMPWLNRSLGQWELYELCETTEELRRIDTASQGNLKMRLIQAFDAKAAIERARTGVNRILGLLPEPMRTCITIHAKSPNEVSLSLYGLEFARVRQAFAGQSFAREDQITFGTGAHETPLNAESEAWFSELTARLFLRRHPTAKHRDALFRLQPERWLESLLRQDVTEVESTLQPAPIYSQVPAFAAADRGMLDLLTVTRQGRLAVLELKAEEDMHLPLQRLDYWIRVRSLSHAGGDAHAGPSDLEKSGYFPGQPLLREAPLLYYVVPALRIHPSMETILAHFSEEIPWMLIAINEGWRTERKVVFRKRAGGS